MHIEWSVNDSEAEAEYKKEKRSEKWFSDQDVLRVFFIYPGRNYFHPNPG